MMCSACTCMDRRLNRDWTGTRIWLILSQHFASLRSRNLALTSPKEHKMDEDPSMLQAHGQTALHCHQSSKQRKLPLHVVLPV